LSVLNNFSGSTFPYIQTGALITLNNNQLVRASVPQCDVGYWLIEEVQWRSNGSLARKSCTSTPVLTSSKDPYSCLFFFISTNNSKLSMPDPIRLAGRCVGDVFESTSK
jgi:hypothetical protein